MFFFLPFFSRSLIIINEVLACYMGGFCVAFSFSFLKFPMVDFVLKPFRELVTRYSCQSCPVYDTNTTTSFSSLFCLFLCLSLSFYDSGYETVPLNRHDIQAL